MCRGWSQTETGHIRYPSKSDGLLTKMVVCGHRVETRLHALALPPAVFDVTIF